MGEWNYNQYPPSYAWNNSQENSNRPIPDMNYYPRNNAPQQYVGFQDFINQYQQSGSYQAFSNNAFQNQQVNLHYNHRYPVVANPDASNYQLQNERRNYGMSHNSENGHKYHQNNSNMPVGSSRVPFESAANHVGSHLDNHASTSNLQYHEMPANDATSVQYFQTPAEHNIASSSKLTATASEFVPQGSKTDSKTFHNSKMIASNKNQDVNRKDEKFNSPSRNNYKSRNLVSDSNRNTNWRKRDDEEPSFSGTSNIENNQVDGNCVDPIESQQSSSRGETSNFRPKKETFHNSKPKYVESNSNYYEGNNRNYRNSKVFNSNPTRQNYENGSKYPQKKNTTYISNETFRHKNFKKNDQYVDKENIQEVEDSSNGTFKKNKNTVKTSAKKDLDINKDIDGAGVSQRERLTEQLDKGVLECLVCCERIRQIDSVWSCNNCFHVLHLKCVKKWAKSSITEDVWRCPACQNNNSIVPMEYRCFCGKQNNPEWMRGGDSAHTCGDICGRLPSGCLRHPCTLLCHAGPCPQCDAVVKKKCECGATTRAMKCSHTQPLLCDNICKKSLNCQVHMCQEKCHSGACQPCSETIDQKCYCKRSVKRTLPCEPNTVGISNFSCGDVCGNELDCGNHNCTKICHDGTCDECALLPKNVKNCPCGQTILTSAQKRESCLDPVPLCKKICSKPFQCGPPENTHKCKSECHHGDCLPCSGKTSVSCRCGHMNKNLKCIDLEKEKDNVRCGKKCSKKQSCGRHRCKTLCCIDVEHRCMLPCNRLLSCGNHRCEDTCHSGHCDLCWRTSFDELRCRCGEAVMYPPIPCGTRPPACTKPCPVPRPCGHTPFHVCHPAPTVCPPCTVLTTTYCHGRHKMRKTIPCHQGEFSCGLPCGKELNCSKHKCIETCHKGNCPTSCTQLCETERPGCGHPCGGSCGHADPCPVLVPCKRPVQVTCSCRRRSAVRPCIEHMRDLQRLQANAGMLAGAMGKPIDIKELIAKGNTTTTLECDDECQIEERNRRLAIGLQIRNPDLSAKLTPRYSDFLKQFALRDEGFCTKVHEKLTELVLLAQNSKQKTRSHSFLPMNHQKRQFVHEMCDQFGCDSVAYDAEPYRNIVATAYREKSWLPALSLMEVIRRDKGQRRVPGPIVTSNSTNSSVNTHQKPSSTGGAWATLSTNYGSSSSDTAKQATASTLETATNNQEPPKPRIDYFDAPPED